MRRIQSVLIGSRPPLSPEYQQKIREITDRMNEDALKEFTGHDILLLCIDRAYLALFPDKHKDGKRKRYEKIAF